MATAVSERARRHEPPRYNGFEQMWINGEWRHGRGEGVSDDRDPYTDDVLVQIPLASEDDLDEAYRAAAAVNAHQLAAHIDHVSRGKEEGARLLLGGEPRGLVFPPHVFAGVTDRMSIAQGAVRPDRPHHRGPRRTRAVEVANDTSYGLSASVVTQDLERGNQFAQRVQPGMTHLNDSPVNDVPTCPFGGEKNSGIGRYNGEWVLDEFTTVHWISVQHEPPRYPF